MDDSMVLRAHWRQLANTMELMLPAAHLSPQSKWQIDWFSCSCTAHGRKSLYLRSSSLLSPKIAPYHGDLGPHLIHGSLSLPESSTQMAHPDLPVTLTSVLTHCSCNVYYLQCFDNVGWASERASSL